MCTIILFPLLLLTAATCHAVGLQIHHAGILASSSALSSYTVTATTGMNGTLEGTTPSPATIAQGTAASFKFNANSGFYVSSVSGCNGTSYNNSSSSITTYTYATGAITGACTVSATFAQQNSCTGGTPYGSNWLRGAPTSDPTNRRSSLAFIGGTSTVYNSGNGVEAYTGTYNPPQAIWEHGNGLDDPSCWYETSLGEGTCWDTSTVKYGEMVIDMQSSRTLARFSLFQMFDNFGKVTSIYVYSHPNTSVAPAMTDSGWVQQGSTTTTAGTYSAPYIYAPTMFTVTPFNTRFLKVRVYNNGSFGTGTEWMEIKGIKGFSN